jgi:IS605 OrfB family transposase
VKRTLPVKLAPTSEQAAALLATIERFNAACDWIAAAAFKAQCANRVTLQKRLYYEVRERFGLSAQMTIHAIWKVVDAYKRDKSIQPRFRSHGAISYDERIMSWRGVEAVSLSTLVGRLTIPVTLGAYQEGRVDKRRGQADLIYRKGEFYLYLTLELPEPPPLRVQDYLGIDLGIVNLAVDSDGTVHTGGAVERKRRIHVHIRRNLQRKGTHSARRKLRRIAGRQRRYQADTNHIISKRVVAVAQGSGRGIAIEDLKGIRDRVTVKRRQRARHSNWTFAQLRSFLTYKAQGAGVPVVLVDPRNTSRTCPECGRVDKRNRPSRGEFRCIECGFAGPADAVAARNVRARALVMEPMVPDGLQSAA